MKKKVVLFGIVIVACVAILSFAISSGLRSETSGKKEDEVVTKPSEKKAGSAYINKEATLSDIKKADDGVNIYMFWGNGCPHCKAQWEYLESIKDDYPYINVYGFEVFYDKDNQGIMRKFAEAMGDKEVNAVPYTIIGDEKLNGFNSSKILKMIENAKGSSFDVYFDKIK